MHEEIEDSGHGSSTPSTPSRGFNTVSKCHEASKTGINESKSSPMAFTIDFCESERKASFGISDSISKFAPIRHRRNSGLTKSDGERDTSPKPGVSPLTAKRNPLQRIIDSSSLNSSNNTPSNRNLSILPAVDHDASNDQSSETGTYTLDLEASRKSVVESEEETSLEWVREWAEKASQRLQEPNSGNRKSDTELLLNDTEKLVLSLEESVGQNPGRIKRDAALSFKSPTTKITNIGLNLVKTRIRDSPEPELYVESKLNRSIVQPTSNSSLRFQRLPREKPTGRSLERSVESTNSEQFQRGDGGRFSLRVGKKQNCSPTFSTPVKPQKITTTVPQVKGTGLDRLSQPRHHIVPAETLHNSLKFGKSSKNNTQFSQPKRATSSLTAKEVELANWNRRRNYDPMRAAALGKEKPVVNIPVDGPGQRNNPDGAVSIKPSIPPAFNRFGYQMGSFAGELSSDSDEPRQTNSLTRVGSISLLKQYPYGDELYDTPTYNITSGSPARQKLKFEALDSLVIATIHTLSNKVRNSSRVLLERLQIEQSDDENGALVEEMISQLRELEKQSAASPSKGTSRELSATLKNLKKIEQVILVLDRILCGEPEEDM